MGSFGISQKASQNLTTAVQACLKRCSGCPRCRYITVNTDARDCSWYSECNMSSLHQGPVGFRSGPLLLEPGQADLPPLQRVVLFMHLEKTAGTLVRSLFQAHGWNRSSYCKRPSVMAADLRLRLSRGEERIFMEHHCRIDWTTPDTLSRVIASARAVGHRVRYRSFTLLRSPLTLAYSQFNYWHSELQVPLLSE